MFWQRIAKAMGNMSSRTGHSMAIVAGLTGSSVLALIRFDFLRQLLAAELLVVVLVLVPLFILGGIIYAIGFASDLGLQAIVVKAQSLPELRRRRPL